MKKESRMEHRRILKHIIIIYTQKYEPKKRFSLRDK